ncbi:MAG TPA: phage integrase SAM-like domain-containing protein [Gammaproteobacteria bacterium]
MLKQAQSELLRTARRVAELLRASPEDSPEAVGAELELDATVQRVLDTIGGPVDDDGLPDVPVDTFRAIRASYRIAGGEDVFLLNDEIEKYLSEIGSGEKPVTKQTLRIKRRILEAFAEFTGNVELREITKRVASEYLEKKLLPAGRSTKTTKDELAHLSAFFNHAHARGKVEYNPFARLSKSVRNGVRGVAKEKRKEWSEEEMKRLFGALDATDSEPPKVNSKGRMMRTPDLTLFAIARSGP